MFDNEHEGFRTYTVTVVDDFAVDDNNTPEINKGRCKEYGSKDC